MISVIATVLNEGESIRRLIDSLAAQTTPPDEIVIVDGGSTDNTFNILNSYQQKLPLKAILAPGVNISEGRNLAIQAASGDIIAVTDAGVKLAPDWLEHLTAPFQNLSVQVVGGFFKGDSHTLFEVAMSATVLPLADEIDPLTFLPSSRSIAFRKSAFDAVGGYPEWLDFCEDLIFDLRLKQKFGAFAFAPDALVSFRPRTSIKSFFKQYKLYARGDGKADLWRKRHLIRYGTYLGAIPVIYLLGRVVHPLLWGLFLLGGAVYTRQPYRRLPTVIAEAAQQHNVEVTGVNKLYVMALVPLIRVVGDVAKMIGYPIGLQWRKANNPPDWRKL